jgi:hypothetical protein
MNTNKKKTKQERLADASVMLFAKTMASINLTGGADPIITSKGKRSEEKQKVVMQKDDWVRVKNGRYLDGAEGKVVKTEKVGLITIVTVRQLNGNELRLPRSHFEFAAYTKPNDLDQG